MEGAQGWPQPSRHRLNGHTMAENPLLPSDFPHPDGPEELGVGSADLPEEDFLMPELPRPLNWNLLTSPEAEQEWEELNDWVNWLRHTYGLPVSVIPPYWHRQPGGQRDRSSANLPIRREGRC